MTTPDEHRRNAIEKAAEATEQHSIEFGKTDAMGNSACVCGRWWDSDSMPGWDEHMAEVAYDAMEPLIRQAVAEELTALGWRPPLDPNQTVWVLPESERIRLLDHHRAEERAKTAEEIAQAIHDRFDHLNPDWQGAMISVAVWCEEQVRRRGSLPAIARDHGRTT